MPVVAKSLREQPSRLGRPPLGPEQISARVASYCERYGVTPKADGLPPFPSGQRETRQHKEWLALYRLLRRSEARLGGPSTGAGRRSSGIADPPMSAPVCAVCAAAIPAQDAASYAVPGRRGPALTLHRRCARLARAAQQAGPDSTGRLLGLLWPRPRR